MIKVSKLRELIEAFTQKDSAFLVRTESEMQQRIKDVDGWLLVMVIPSSDTRAFSSDNIAEDEQAIVYMVTQRTESNTDYDDMVENCEEAQLRMAAFKLYLYDISQSCEHPLHEICKQMDFNTFHTDPEYNYMGCDGYSLSFVLKTNWF